jgi:drug/metabolite transporter (DMT)-like permease
MFGRRRVEQIEPLIWFITIFAPKMESSPYALREQHRRNPKEKAWCSPSKSLPVMVARVVAPRPSTYLAGRELVRACVGQEIRYEGGHLANTNRLYDWGMLLLCNMIWGSQFVIYKVISRQAGPVFAALFPITIATLLLIPIVSRKRRKTATPDGNFTPRGDIFRFILIGVFGQVVAQLFVAWGVRFTLASNAALMALGLPIFTAIMAYLLLGERMTPVRWWSFALAIAGVMECSGIRWGEVNLTGSKYLVGNLMFFCAMNASAFYNTYSKRLLRRYSPLEVLFRSYCVVVVVMLPVAILTEPHTFRNIPNFTPAVWLGFFLLAFFQYFLAMLMFLSVLTRLDATQAGLSNYLISFFGLIVAFLVLHERLTKFMVFGGLLVLASTLLVTIYEGRQELQHAPTAPPGS